MKRSDISKIIAEELLREAEKGVDYELAAKTINAKLKQFHVGYAVTAKTLRDTAEGRWVEAKNVGLSDLGMFDALMDDVTCDVMVATATLKNGAPIYSIALQYDWKFVNGRTNGINLMLRYYNNKWDVQ